jgi:hypothetical protein
MTQRPDDTRLHDWLDETVGPTPDPVEGTHQVMSQVEETSQAGRWLPFPLLHRKAKAKTRTTEYQPNPIPASNGHTPTVLGRTQSMFSPVKAITAGALVFAIGGVFLIAQPFDQQGGNVPGAATDTEPVPATWVTGSVVYGMCASPNLTSQDGVTREQYRCEPQTWTSSDDRLGGSATIMWNADLYEVDGQTYSLSAQVWEVRNDSGGWLCRNPDGLNRGSGKYPTAVQGTEMLTCVGNGANDGLTAVLVANWTTKTIEGLIISGEGPPLPDVSPAE